MRNEIVKSNIPHLTVYASKRSRTSGSGILSSLHYHDELELLLIFEGELHCSVGGVDYVARKGDIVFVNTRIPHSTSCIGATGNGLLQFRQNDFIDGEISKTIKYSLRFRDLGEEPVRILSDPELWDAVMEVLDEAASRDTAYEFYIRSGIFRILGYLYRTGILSDAVEMYNSKEVQRILPALAYVNEHYSENISLDEVSGVMGLDPSYFCRVFKAATGATFTEYLNFVRVCKAETMLARGTMSILEISEAVGFSSISYFNRIFKRYRACSPRLYRKAKYVAISKGEKEV